MILYGIRTCDRCRKAAKALAAAGHSLSFRDIRAEPLSAAERGRFIDAFAGKIVNRASATWRGLADEQKAEPTGAQLAAHPTLMKRPVIDTGTELLLGWGPDVQDTLLK